MFKKWKVISKYWDAAKLKMLDPEKVYGGQQDKGIVIMPKNWEPAVDADGNPRCQYLGYVDEHNTFHAGQEIPKKPGRPPKKTEDAE